MIPFFTITVTGNNPQPSTFVLRPGDSQFVTLGPDDYSVNENPSLGSGTSFSGDCTQTAPNSAEATATAGQHQTCTITNTQR